MWFCIGGATTYAFCFVLDSNNPPVSPTQTHDAAFHVEEQPQPKRRQRRRRGNRRMASEVRTPQESPPGSRSGASPAGEESDAASSGTPPDERTRRPAPVAADSAPQARRSRPRYVRPRHQAARQGFSPQPPRKSGAPPQQPQRDDSRDSPADATSGCRKRPRAESRSASPCLRLPTPPPPPPGLREDEDARHPDASSSRQGGGHADASSSWQSGRRWSKWNHAPGSRWAEKHRQRAIRHQQELAAAAAGGGSARDPDRLTGPQEVGQACVACQKQHYALRCKRKMCGTCCALQPGGKCKRHQD